MCLQENKYASRLNNNTPSTLTLCMEQNHASYCFRITRSNVICTPTKCHRKLWRIHFGDFHNTPYLGTKNSVG